MANIVVIGETGQLAQSFRHLDGVSDYQFVGRKQLDLSNSHSVEKYFANNKPDVILNLAAYTQVDKAESERELAFAVNATASQLLARNCKRYFYISTDYVYGGENKRPYLETDKTFPVNYYGETKLHGEQLAQKENSNTVIVRTSWVYSPYGVNFAKRIAELAAVRPQLKVVFDQIGTPTWAPDLAKVLKLMVEKSDMPPGIYNYSNEGVCSWYDFAREIVKASGANCEVLPIPTSEFPTPAKRPPYSVLDKSKIKSALGIEIPNWLESFEECKKALFT